MRKTTQRFIDEAIVIHGDKYCYDDTVYNGNTSLASIKCYKHGIFNQKPISHLRGSGCQKCAHEAAFLDNNTVISRYISIHGNKYDYSETKYINCDTKIDIICKSHGKFQQWPKDHENGHGCSKCFHVNKYTTSEFIDVAANIHGNRYDYFKFEYLRFDNPSIIICKDHGEFLQSPSGHLQGYNCPKCGRIAAVENTKNTLNEFIDRSNILHNGKYDYSKVNYSGSTCYVDIICSKHGIFNQLSNNHLQGHGCPTCSKENFQSRPEFEIKNFIESYGFTVLQSYRLSNKELDLYIPEKQLAIEYNGLYWHSSNSILDDKKISKKHIDKTELCEKNNISLLHIFEDEWLSTPEIWKSMILNKLGIVTKIYGRKTKCCEITSKISNEFCKLNHMQGSAMAKHHYGLLYEDKLVAVMSLSKSRYGNNDYEIIRYCNLLNHSVIGGFSKLLSNFRSLYSGSIVSYANRRWSNGNLYEKAGFVKERISVPCYYYIKNNKLYHRSSFMKHKLSEKVDIFDPTKTEIDNMYMNKFRRIWDCGSIVYTLA